MIGGTWFTNLNSYHGVILLTIMLRSGVDSQPVDDVAAAEVICNRGIENYPRAVGNGNRLSSRTAGEEILGKWRGAGSLNCEVKKPAP